MNYLLAISGGWIMAGQLLLGLSLLIVLHEFGHYITAKWFKCRVEKFYLFFDPWFSLFKKKVGETEYGIGWLPLGGYVKISGMIDESMDKEALAQPAQPHEFRSKPAWQRLIIMLGGVIMNVIVAFIIYAFVLYKWGETKIPLNSLKDGIGIQNKELMDLGFKSGDKIISVNGESIDYFEDVAFKLVVGTEDRKVEIERDGKREMLTIPYTLFKKLINSKKAMAGFILPRTSAIVMIGDSTSKSLSYRAGIRNYDKVLKIDSIPIQFFDQISLALKDKADKVVDVQILRGKDTMLIKTQVDCESKIGLGIMSLQELDSMGVLKIETKKYSLIESFPAGVSKTFTKLKEYVEQFKMILSPKTEAYKGMGGFKGMAKIYGEVWDWERFWSMTAMISIILAFMNLLPIPALDGGHVMFTLYEMIFRRKPNEKFLEYAQIGGMILLFGMMLYANFNDWFGYGKDKKKDCKYELVNGSWKKLD